MSALIKVTPMVDKTLPFMGMASVIQISLSRLMDRPAASASTKMNPYLVNSNLTQLHQSPMYLK
jgi:hypothetical protein